MADKKERLKKLYALAMRGVGGEREQAQAILFNGCTIRRNTVKGNRGTQWITSSHIM